MRTQLSAIALASLCLVAAPSIGTAQGHGPIHEEQLSPQTRQQLAALRAATAQYHDFDAATQSGMWEVPVPSPLECLDGATGGMGYHFVNPNNVGVLDPTRPQALIYEPEQDGSMRLVGAEFIVFAPESAPPPVLFDQEYHWNQRFQIWALHVWVWRANPDGIFADYNPIVSCRYEF